jgi:hypothetical protein
MKEVSFNGADIAGAIAAPLANTRKYLETLATRIQETTDQTFASSGSRAGHPQWQPLSQRTLHPSRKDDKGFYKVYFDKWNRRPGTDNAKSRRYSDNSKPLLASGGFRGSFVVIELSDTRLLFGSRLTSVNPDYIAKNRDVLFITDQDSREWKDLFITFWEIENE